MDKRALFETTELAKEILELLRESSARCASILASSDMCLAILKETNAMLAAHREAVASRGLRNG